MTPQDQQFVHIVDNEGKVQVHGDCQRAVIASLLDRPIAEVPHFLADANGVTRVFWENIQKFCRLHGFAYLTVRAGPMHFFGDDGDVYHEIAGPSPRGGGMLHAIVGKNGQPFYDPHPSRDGLAGTPADWEFAYLVRVGEPSLTLHQGARCMVTIEFAPDRREPRLLSWNTMPHGQHRLYAASSGCVLAQQLDYGQDMSSDTTEAMRVAIGVLENIKGGAKKWGGWSGAVGECDAAIAILQVAVARPNPAAPAICAQSHNAQAVPPSCK